jgi:rubrerythrin
MSNAFCEPCSKCFDLAIEVGRAADDFYRGLAVSFSREKKISNVFRTLARDEDSFVQALQAVKDQEAHSPAIHASARELTPALRALRSSLGKTLGAKPKDLDEAWRWACDLERSILNDSFLRLTAGLSQGNGRSGDFFAKIVATHQRRLRTLGEKYNVSKRKTFLPQSAI